MTNIFSLDLSKIIYDTMRTHQEKTDRILEPLQVMIQLALLSFCPKGTKLCVNNNLLSLQLPTFSQGAWRWFNKDSKDDLYFLFNAVKRFYIWYKEDDNPVYDYILKLSRKGIAKLIETYKGTDKVSITHTLSLYKSILEMNSIELFGEAENTPMEEVFQEIRGLYENKLLDIISNILHLMEDESNETYKRHYFDGLQKILIPLERKIQEWIQKLYVS